MLLTASHILPLSSDIILDGSISIKSNLIQNISSKSEKVEPTETKNLGQMLLLPGFVNAHCHTELTQIGPLNQNSPENKGASFVPWIVQLVSHKNQLKEEAFEKGIKTAVKKLIRSGVTTIGDHISFNAPWEALLKSPLRGRLFPEVLGAVPEVSADIYHTLQLIRDEMKKIKSLISIHISPHAVHTVHAATLKKVISEEEGPLSTHLAESQDEKDYFQKRGGDMMNLIRNQGIDPSHHSSTAIQWIRNENLDLSKLLIIHGNYLSQHDLDCIHKYQLSIVHCPGSHTYFAHQDFPLEDYEKAGINIGIGTDSITSNTQLNMMHELRLVHQKYPSVPLEKIFKMACIGGAKALQLDDQIGSLENGKKADLIGFKLNKTYKNKHELLEDILKRDQIDFMMIDGKEIPLE